jgi:hypothetical protein
MVALADAVARRQALWQVAVASCTVPAPPTMRMVPFGRGVAVWKARAPAGLRAHDTSATAAITTSTVGASPATMAVGAEMPRQRAWPDTRPKSAKMRSSPGGTFSMVTAAGASPVRAPEIPGPATVATNDWTSSPNSPRDSTAASVGQGPLRGRCSWWVTTSGDGAVQPLTASKAAITAEAVGVCRTRRRSQNLIQTMRM